MNEKLLGKFLSSFSTDNMLVKYDIDACTAMLNTLVKNKIIKKNQVQKVLKILNIIKEKPNKISPDEDVHFAVEKTLENMLGKDKYLAGIIRTARSRNDLVVSDERMYLKEEISKIEKLLKDLILYIVKVADENIDVPMVGYTHLQPAQPVLFSHYILSFAWWFLRDMERFRDCYRRVDVSVLGSAAFAGSSFDVDRFDIAKKLGFSKVSQNSVDAVSDRDFIVEFIFCCAVVMMHLSRIAEEFIIWISPNFSYMSLPKELTSGSSIMPQKNNPDFLELIRAKASKVYSDLLGILIVLKGLPLSYNRDMQEDKVYLKSTVETVKDSLEIMRLIFDKLKIKKEKLKEDLEKYDYVLSTEIANFLVKKLKFPFKLAHLKVQELLNFCYVSNKKIKDLELSDYNKVFNNNFHPKMFKELKEKISLINVSRNYKTYGGSSLDQVRLQIKTIRKGLSKK
ncbi:MAG: argininosuccinate lyase [Endomicrobia bacterium]|nr:argininosuccinate lyase [Endomicrobiia bacterium]